MCWIALTREVSQSIERCELTHMDRQPIDVGRARAQHAAYEQALRDAGCRVKRVPPATGCPDSVFVEDTAVVLPEIAVITRLGALSRRSETPAVADALREYRPLAEIEPPGTLDGGDVLVVGRRVFIGQTARTNSEGLGQIRSILAPLGYDVKSVPVHGCLHLKSAATALTGALLLVQPLWVDPDAFHGVTVILVDPDEVQAANALSIGTQIVYPAAFPKTTERLAARGLRVLPVDVDEIAKAEGAVTCCSLVFQA